MNADLPLVSIIVITYNSSKYVLETLESAKAQTYQNIELIISDDGSQDETVKLCEKWLAENKDRFIDSQLITVKKNTGIPANCNRGVKAAKGEWVKLIAGDDVLTCEAISFFVNYFSERPNAKLIQGLCKTFAYDINDYKQVIPGKSNYYFFRKDAYHQFDLMLKNNFIIAPGTFIKRELILKIGGFDEEFKSMEDFPFWLKVLQNGSKFYLMEKHVVFYRKHENAVSVTFINSKSSLLADHDLRIKILTKYLPNTIYTKRKIFRYYILRTIDKYLYGYPAYGLMRAVAYKFIS